MWHVPLVTGDCTHPTAQHTAGGYYTTGFSCTYSRRTLSRGGRAPYGVRRSAQVRTHRIWWSRWRRVAVAVHGGPVAALQTRRSCPDTASERLTSDVIRDLYFLLLECYCKVLSMLDEIR